MRAKQVYSSLISVLGRMLHFKKCVFKAIRKQTFSLLKGISQYTWLNRGSGMMQHLTTSSSTC